MPPRLGCPASAPQSAEGLERGKADSVTPAARPAFRSSRRLTPLACWACACRVSMGSPPSLLLAVQPQRRHATAVIEGQVRRVVLHIRLPGTGIRNGDGEYIVLLLRNIALNVKDELLARLQLLGPALFLQHGQELRIIDMATVAQVARFIHAIQHAIRFPSDANGPHSHALVLA